MKHIIIPLLILPFIIYYSLPPSPPQLYQLWKQQHHISYASSQDLYRYYTFNKNYQLITQHNDQHPNDYQMGLNQFSALTQPQFIRTYLNSYIPFSSVSIQPTNNQQTFGDIDWVAKGAVAPAKNTGQCAISTGFAATSTIETLYWAVNQSLKILSQQYIIDCCGVSNPCAGGFNNIQFVYKCIKDKGFSTNYTTYSGQPSTCKKAGDFFISSYQNVKGCDAISNKLLENTLAVIVDATNWATYRSGVFSNCATNLNHMVTLVGESSTYWKIKNEWGSTWGQNGFIRIAKGNTCGVCSSASIPYKK